MYKSLLLWSLLWPSYFYGTPTHSKLNFFSPTLSLTYVNLIVRPAKWSRKEEGKFASHSILCSQWGSKDKIVNVTCLEQSWCSADSSLYFLWKTQSLPHHLLFPPSQLEKAIEGLIWHEGKSVFASIHHELHRLLFSHSVMFESLQTHGLQHARLPCPSLFPRVYSNSCPLTRWCHPTISSCCPLFLLPSIFPSIKDFSNESALCIRWPKYWSFHFSISPSNKYSGLISFRIDWFDLLAVQESSLTPQFKSICFGPQPSLWSNSHIHTWLQEKP